jgi:hypothetical protein
VEALLLAALLVALPAGAQVASVCGPGKNCSVRRLNTKVANTTATACFQNDNLQALELFANGNVFHFRSSYSYPSPCAIDYPLSGISIDNGTNVVSFPGSGGIASTYGMSASIAFASFPACTGGIAGRLLYDSTNTVWRWCDGAQWQPMGASATFSAHRPATFTPLNTPFAAAKLTGPTFAGKVSVTSLTVGVGTTGTVQLYDSNAGAAVGTCNFTCTSAVGTVANCSIGAAVAAAAQLEFRLTSDGCTTDPELNVSVVLGP